MQRFFVTNDTYDFATNTAKGIPPREYLRKDGPGIAGRVPEADAALSAHVTWTQGQQLA